MPTELFGGRALTLYVLVRTAFSLQAGADVNKANPIYGDSAMKVAMQSRALDVVKVLTKYHAK